MTAFPSSVPVLTTPRLILRAVCDTDASDVFEINSDPETVRYSSHPAYTSLDEVAGFLARTYASFDDQSQLRWAVERLEDKKMIGLCSLFGLDFSNLRAEIGYTLNRQAWGQGYMSEAVRAVLDYSFNHLQLRRIEADAEPRNTASTVLLERLGFKLEGLLKERWFVNGEVQDTAFYGLLRSGWQASTT
jgi:RimJ/RimL family protein N-acetyltransferase